MSHAGLAADADVLGDCWIADLRCSNTAGFTCQAGGGEAQAACALGVVQCCTLSSTCNRALQFVKGEEAFIAFKGGICMK